jgi:hypothetical protein
MLRKIMIAAAAVTFLGAMSVSTTADAQRGHMGGFGGFRGGGGVMHGGGFGGFRGGAIGMRGGFGARPFVGARSFGARPFIGAHRFAGARPFIGARHFAFNRFHRFHRFNRFAFASVPFFVGAGIYSSCWSWVPTAWGWRRVWVCGDYGYGYGY